MLVFLSPDNGSYKVEGYGRTLLDALGMAMQGYTEPKGEIYYASPDLARAIERGSFLTGPFGDNATIADDWATLLQDHPRTR